MSPVVRRPRCPPAWKSSFTSSRPPRADDASRTFALPSVSLSQPAQRRAHVDRLLEDITEGRPSIGLAAGSSDLIELCAFIGFRWVMIDQMFSANDWARTEELIRTSEAAG